MTVVRKSAVRWEEWKGAYERILFPDPAVEQRSYKKYENATGRKHARIP